jgi:peptide/nickel transport system permease protein
MTASALDIPRRRPWARAAQRYSVRYVVRRVVLAFVTVFLAATLDFALPRLAGGDPAQYLASTQALGSPTVAKALAKQFGLNGGNALTQYGHYLNQLVHGNLGVSYQFYPRSVASVLWDALPYTLGLVLTATVISFLVGWTVGIVAAWRRGSIFDETSVGISFFLHGIPYFWTAMMLLFGLSFWLGWFPDAHAFSISTGHRGLLSTVGDAIYHGTLPVLSLIVTSVAGHLLIMRNNMVSVMREDYVMLARAKGMSTPKLALKYVARTAMLPSFTGLMLSLGTVIGGAILTEEVYSYPGIGYVVYNAILEHDYPLIQGAFLFIAVAVVAMNLLADLLLPLIDPRISLQ